MKKFLVVLVLMTQFFVCPIAAQESTVIIQDHNTPLAAKKDNQLVWAYAGFGLLLLGGFAVLTMKKNNTELYIQHISDNRDGSYTVTWGYKNLFRTKDRPTHFGFNIKKGSAIILKQPEFGSIKSGSNRNAAVTIVNKNTELEWIMDDQKVKVDEKIIQKKLK